MSTLTTSPPTGSEFRTWFGNGLRVLFRAPTTAVESLLQLIVTVTEMVLEHFKDNGTAGKERDQALQRAKGVLCCARHQVFAAGLITRLLSAAVTTVASGTGNGRKHFLALGKVQT
jgi:hypothetical protein